MASESRRAPWVRAAHALVVPAAWGVDLLIWHNDNELRYGGRDAPDWLVPGVGFAVFATLLLRWRYPVWVLAVHSIWTIAMGTVMAHYLPTMGLLVALQAVSLCREPKWSVPALLSCVVSLGASTVLQEIDNMKLHPTGDFSFDFLLIGLIELALMATAAWALGDRERQWDVRTAAQLRTATEQALRAERLRIARELHDIVSHSVNIMVIQAAGARAICPPEQDRVADALGAINDLGAQAMDELRRMLCLLRSAGDDETDPGETWPGADDIPALLRRSQAGGLAVNFTQEGTPVRLDPSVGLTAYRIVQEALTNVLKHAGEGASAEVRLAWGPDQLAVMIEDRAPAGRRRSGGRGISTGHGLLGLHERVTTVGGTLQTSRLSTGFLVHAQLPVARSAATAVPDGGSRAA